MHPTLPVELSDWIIDQLHDDPGALLACCLASRSMCARSQPLLFRTVVLATERVGVNLASALARSPRLTQHIQRVDLKTYLDSCGAFLDHGPFCAVEALSVAGGLTRRVTDLKTTFPNITTLSLKQHTIQQPLTELLSAFPPVAHLHLHRVQVDQGAEARGPLRLPLQTLVLVDCDMDIYSMFALDTDKRLPTLRRLELHSGYHGRQTQPSIQPYLACITHSLSSLVEELCLESLYIDEMEEYIGLTPLQ